MRIALIGTFFCLLLSCKKEGSEPTAHGYTSNNFTPSKEVAVSGIFTVFEYSLAGMAPPNPVANVFAFFSSSTAVVMDGSGVPVRRVKLNGDSLIYDTTLKRYSRGGIPGLPIETWEINGKNGIATFSFSPINFVPRVPDIKDIKDTISLSSGIVIRLNNCSGIKTGILAISDGTTSTNNYPIKNGNNTIVIPPSAFSNLVADGGNGRLMIYLDNKKTFYIETKHYQFNRIINYHKPLWLNP